MSIAKGEEVCARVDEHDGHQRTLDSLALRWSEQHIVQPVLTAGSQYQQVVTKIPLPLAGFANERETVLAGFDDFVGNRLFSQNSRLLLLRIWNLERRYISLLIATI